MRWHIIPPPSMITDAVFPKGVEPPECVRELLRALYPTVRWDRVTIHPTLPAYLKFAKHAITLPDPLSFTHLRIFTSADQWKAGPTDPRLIALLVHEVYHVLQYQQSGAGLGPLRPFAVKYIAAALMQGGGRANRYEAPAYEHEEARFLPAYNAWNPKPCAAGLTSDDIRGAVRGFVERHPDLVIHKAKP